MNMCLLLSSAFWTIPSLGLEWRPAAGLQVPLATRVRQEGPGEISEHQSIDASWNFRIEAEIALRLSESWDLTAGSGLEPEVRLARNLEGAGFQAVSPYLGGEGRIWSGGRSTMGAWARTGWTIPVPTDQATRDAKLEGLPLFACGMVLSRESLRIAAGWSLFGTRIESRSASSEWWQHRLHFMTGVAWP